MHSRKNQQRSLFHAFARRICSRGPLGKKGRGRPSSWMLNAKGTQSADLSTTVQDGLRLLVGACLDGLRAAAMQHAKLPLPIAETFEPQGSGLKQRQKHVGWNPEVLRRLLPSLPHSQSKEVYSPCKLSVTWQTLCRSISWSSIGVYR